MLVSEVMLVMFVFDLFKAELAKVFMFMLGVESTARLSRLLKVEVELNCALTGGG